VRLIITVVFGSSGPERAPEQDGNFHRAEERRLDMIRDDFQSWRVIEIGLGYPAARDVDRLCLLFHRIRDLVAVMHAAVLVRPSIDIGCVHVREEREQDEGNGGGVAH